MKKQKGITLISLIITIILMLILVGLTISVALNGGIFSITDEATIKKEKAVIYEQIVGAMQLANNGKIIVNETYGKVLEMYGAEKVRPINPGTVDENTTAVTFTVKGKKGTYKYKITEKRIIQDPPQEEPITNPWIENGLSPNFEYGKWYGWTEDDGQVNKWFVLYEDGSYSQEIKDVGVTSYTWQQMAPMLGGTITLSGNDFIVNGQWKATLNENDGTVTLEFSSEEGHNEILHVLEDNQ